MTCFRLCKTCGAHLKEDDNRRWSDVSDDEWKQKVALGLITCNEVQSVSTGM